ncbi:hypothetical protein AHF37_08198 [Paragonimus kellicotti]|nr:hypothetical protein AHF37_08198 [Paragonimus kellicotti]
MLRVGGKCLVIGFTAQVLKPTVWSKPDDRASYVQIACASMGMFSNADVLGLTVNSGTPLNSLTIRSNM